MTSKNDEENKELILCFLLYAWKIINSPLVLPNLRPLESIAWKFNLRGNSYLVQIFPGLPGFPVNGAGLHFA